MLKNVAEKFEYEYSREELENLANNIFKKMILLNISLPDLAKQIGMEYQTLWRIAYKKSSYMPNLRVLFPIANFFEVTVADLLKNPNLPQYVPLIRIKDVYEYLNNKLSINSDDNYDKILCTEYLHEHAFALAIQSSYLERIMPIKYVFKPYTKIINDSYVFIRYKGIQDLFIKINHITIDQIEAINVYNNKIIQLKQNKIEVLALAVKQIVDNDLI